MHPRSLHRDLFSHNDWAWSTLFALADELSASQLDRSFAMGLGSLRATFDHVCQVERLWLDRWQNRPWYRLPPADPGVSLDELNRRFRETAADRDAFLHKASKAQPIRYRNTAGHDFTHKLGDLALHVTNHGVHHRAQALNMLRRLGATVPNLDYLFFRLEQPTVDLPADTVERLRQRGIAISDQQAPPPRLALDTLRRYYAYSDWGTHRLFAAAQGLSDAQLDQPFEMGLGSLRKTLLHIRDAEQWWLDNWIRGPESSFPHSPPTTPLDGVQGLFEETSARRRDYMVGLADDDLQRVTTARPGGATVLACRLGESMLQLCCHATHHRAQALNMLRQLGNAPPVLELVAWVREAD